MWRWVSDRLASRLAVRLAQVATALLDQTSDPREQWPVLRDLLRELAELRKEDRKAIRLGMERRRWERELEREEAADTKRELKQMKKKAVAPLWAMLQLEDLAKLFGGGERGREAAAFILENQHDLPPGKLRWKSHAPEAGTAPVDAGCPQSNPGESNQIRPSQTETE